MLLSDVWVCGRVTDDTDKRRLVWRIMGIYENEQKAEDACTTAADFVRPFSLNMQMGGLRLKEIRFPMRAKRGN